MTDNPELQAQIIQRLDNIDEALEIIAIRDMHNVILQNEEPLNVSLSRQEPLLTDWLIATGTIIVPILVWFFGAQRAEKKKQETDLRNSINFLTSVSLSTLIGFLDTRKSISNIIEQTKNFSVPLDNSTEHEFTKFMSQMKIAFEPWTFTDPFADISFEKYSDIIPYKPNFVINLMKINRRIQRFLQALDQRNIDIKNSLNSNVIHIVGALDYINGLFDADKKRLPIWYNELGEIIIDLHDMLMDIHDIRRMLPRLGIEYVKFSEKQQGEIDEIKKVVP